MRERASVAAAIAALGLVALACKSGERGASTTSASASASSSPPKAWIDQARTAWPGAKIKRVTTDAGDRLASIKLTSATPPKPADVAERLRAVLAVEAPDRPCSLLITGTDGEEHDGAAEKGTYFIGHMVIEPSVAYGALEPREVAKRFAERFASGSDSFGCSTPTWLIVNTPGHFQHNWRAYVKDYSNVWDGSKKDALEAEKICEDAADLDLFRGETFPDSSDAIENGVNFPQTSSQTIRWRSYTNWEHGKSWFSCEVNANEAPTIKWDHPR